MEGSLRISMDSKKYVFFCLIEKEKCLVYYTQKIDMRNNELNKFPCDVCSVLILRDLLSWNAFNAKWLWFLLCVLEFLQCTCKRITHKKEHQIQIVYTVEILTFTFTRTASRESPYMPAIFFVTWDRGGFFLLSLSKLIRNHSEISRNKILTQLLAVAITF